MQKPRRTRLSPEMLVKMAMVDAWLVATDPWYAKPPRAAFRRIPSHASGNGQGHAITDNGGHNDDGGEDDAVLCDEDSLPDTSTDDEDDVVVTASNKKPRGVECGHLFAWDVCDPRSPFLLAGIYASSIVHEAPPPEEPQASSEVDEEAVYARMRQRRDDLDDD
jgi:hypothetical protein